MQEEIIIEREQFNDLVVNEQEKPVFLLFWRHSCTPCNMFEPYLAKFWERMKDSVVFACVDVLETPDIADKFAVITLPTSFIIWKGRIIKQYFGIQETEDLVSAVNSIFTGKINLDMFEPITPLDPMPVQNPETTTPTTAVDTPIQQ